MNVDRECSMAAQGGYDVGRLVNIVVVVSWQCCVQPGPDLADHEPNLRCALKVNFTAFSKGSDTDDSASFLSSVGGPRHVQACKC